MYLFLLLSVVFLLVILTFVWPPDSPWSPWWRTSKKVARSACNLSKLTHKDIVYELGSGDGEFILMAGTNFKVKKAIGIEIDYTRYWVSKLRAQISHSKNVQFIRRDFKKVKMNDATVVYFYLVPAVIKRIMPKLKRELKPGTKIMSYRYEVPLKLLAKKDDVRLYEI